ncbi:MAG: NADH-quinone oxidoreductase subunit NuoG [Actinobacteria bacterium]|nr:NADH-quinone oxidoreductase subunit NuoG [Actinomycetota bacterium]
MTTIDTTDANDMPPQDPNAVSININGRTVAARKGDFIIAAADSVDEYIPRFCYHPRMSSVGMCRQCMVEVEGPRGPMMVVSCMTPVADGQIVRTDTPQVKRAQEGMIELLLANHPLDCPVCDKGGECPLQDQAFSHGAGESRFVEEKRHYEKPIPISDLVFLDRERCILCDRCTRFADEVAGDPLISFTQRGNNTQIMTFPDEPFASYFSGNTVQICPVGALTASPYRFKARPWDLEQRESTCTTCSVGCRTVVQSSRDELLRYQGVDSDPVNWGWLCDKGRFNFQSTNSEDRLSTPQIKSGDSFITSSWSDALESVARVIRHSREGSVAILGGARGTNEDAYMWGALADAAGITMRDAQLDDGLPASVFSYPQATIDSACAGGTVILLAPDIKEELPVLYLRLRDAVQKKRIRLIEISSHETGLTKYAWKSIRAESGTAASAIPGLLAQADISEQLASGPVVVVAGRPNLAESASHTMEALSAVLTATPSASVLPVLRRGNVRGALSLGLAPRNGNDAATILEASAKGNVDCLILLGADPLSDVADIDLARRGIAGAKFVVAIDTFLTASASHADVVLPAAAYGEKDGTTMNLEGRVTSVVQKITPHGTSRADWMIAVELLTLLGHESNFTTLSDIQNAMSAAVPGFGSTTTAVAIKRDGVVVSVTPQSSAPAVASVAAPRNSYEFRLDLSRKLFDRAIGTITSPSLANLATEVNVFIHPLDLDRVGAAEGTNVRVSNSHSSIVLPVRASSSIPRGTAWVPFNQIGADVRELVRRNESIIDVRIESM